MCDIADANSDPEVATLLRTWGVPEVIIDRFQENEIKTNQLRHLSEEILKELCPLIGHRILIKSKLNEYFIAHTDTDTTLTTKSVSDEDLGDLDNISVENLFSTVRPPFPDFDLKTLLSTSPCGKSIITYYKSHNTLTSKHRNQLVVIIVRHIFTRAVNQWPEKEHKILAVSDVLKILTLIAEYRLWNDIALGEHWVIDYTNGTISQTAQWGPTLVTKCVYYMSKCIGAKIIGIHIVNFPSYAEATFNLFKMFINPKVIDRIHFYSEMSEVIKLFPKEVIPEDMGGDGPTTQEISDNWRRVLQSTTWRQRFIEQDNVKSDESKRPITKKANEMFGVAGSFRKLQLD